MIRSRIFLEGNFFVDLRPGTPGAPIVHDGDTLPASQTATPVQLDQLLTALQTGDRQYLQDLLKGFGDALIRRPSAADNARTYEYLLRVSMIASLRRAQELG